MKVNDRFQGILKFDSFSCVLERNFFFVGTSGEISSLAPQIKLEKKFGQSPVFIASTLLEEGGVPSLASSASLLKEAIHVISCGYEDKTEWGKEVCEIKIKFICIQICIRHIVVPDAYYMHRAHCYVSGTKFVPDT